MITNPEIEILIVIDRDDYAEYCKEKSKVKPSSFCKRKYGYSGIKHKGFMRKCFNNTAQLAEAIRKHKTIIGRGYLTIADLLK